MQKGVKSVGDQYLNEKAQGQFVLVSNIGDEAQLLSDSSQKVRDAKVREFPAGTGVRSTSRTTRSSSRRSTPGAPSRRPHLRNAEGTEQAGIELHDSRFSDGVNVQLG
nr:DUF4352 domain-containing protein [Terracoccus sp. 273MFTsu3.1]